MTAPAPGTLSRREARLGTQMSARGERALFDALLRVRGVVAVGRFRIESLYAVGGEGAIYLAQDLGNANAPPRIAKVPLLPWHKPVQLTSRLLRSRRQALGVEAKILRSCRSPFLPRFVGLLGIDNPLVEKERGGAFAEPEACLIMEKLGGFDLDAWLCKVHRGRMPKDKLRSTLDRLCVGVIQALVDLGQRGFIYADLRPGNIRVVGRPQRRVRFLDAGACVPEANAENRFPHVPSYLPPDLFRELNGGVTITPSQATQAVMAGRTLFEIASGNAPKAGRHLDVMRLLRSSVSPPVSEVIAALADGSLPTCTAALESLATRAKRRVPGR